MNWTVFLIIYFAIGILSAIMFTCNKKARKGFWLFIKRILIWPWFIIHFIYMFTQVIIATVRCGSFADAAVDVALKHFESVGEGEYKNLLREDLKKLETLRDRDKELKKQLKDIKSCGGK